MKYNAIQKFLSGFLIFFLLGSTTFRFPLPDISSYAAERNMYDLVSILVDETLYPQITQELDTYSKNIANSLTKTKVVILPVPKSTTAHQIASMNERLFFEGYKGFQQDSGFSSRLAGTILVGDLPIPYVSYKGQAYKSILPYTDFENKSFIYNVEQNEYQENKQSFSEIQAEVWHGVINPNTGNAGSDLEQIKQYFAKNNDFYKGQGLYESSSQETNGNRLEEDDTTYQPYVFYYDYFRESKALNSDIYAGYELYLQYKEDLNYNRYTKKLANLIKNSFLDKNRESMQDLLKNLQKTGRGTGIDASAVSENKDLLEENIPDIQTRYIMKNTLKKFVEVFSKGSIGEMRKDVYNAGRYNNENAVNVDFVSYMISVLDIVNDETMKEISDDLEGEIDRLVDNGLAMKLPVGLQYVPETTDGYIDISSLSGPNAPDELYRNYMFGTPGESITKAEQCSFYRGSMENGGTLVEANRGNNIRLVKDDIERLKAEKDKRHCLKKEKATATGETYALAGDSLQGLWGKNSPLYLQTENIGTDMLSFKDETDFSGAVVPLFDITGSKEISDISHTPNPYQCVEDNFLLAFQKAETEESDNGENRFGESRGGGGSGEKYAYILPEIRDALGLTNSAIDPSSRWRCDTDANGGEKRYEGENLSVYLAADSSPGMVKQQFGECFFVQIYFNDTLVKRLSSSAIMVEGPESKKQVPSDCVEKEGSGEEAEVTEKKMKGGTFVYKTLSSAITHKSPEPSTLSGQITSMLTPSLPVDRNRYIDFIGTDGEYNKINYPYLYRLKLSIGEEKKLENVQNLVDSYLDKKSKQINEIIEKKSHKAIDVTAVKGIENHLDVIKKDIPALDTYDLVVQKELQTGEYPVANFDLKQYLQNKGEKEIIIGNERLVLSYYDALVFSVYWNNLDSVSAKYGFVVEHYLSDQSLDKNPFFLPKNRKQYEIAYLGAPGTASKMYVGLDPNKKKGNPFSDIVSQNQDLSAQLLASNIGVNQEGESPFECAPPEGVPIWEWIPAVVCWLEDMLPPTITISEGSCGQDTLFENAIGEYEFGGESAAERESEVGGNGITEGYPNQSILDEQGENNNVHKSCTKDGGASCVENIKNVNFTVESEKYPYNSFVNMVAYLENSDKKRMSWIHVGKMQFEVMKIANEEGQVLYDKNSDTKNDEKILKKYISFSKQSTPLKNGQAYFGFSVGMENLDISVRSYFTYGAKKEYSIEKKIQVRGDVIPSAVYTFSDGKVVQKTTSIVASDKTNVFLLANTNNVDGVASKIQSLSNNQKLILAFGDETKAGALKLPVRMKLTKKDDPDFLMDGKIGKIPEGYHRVAALHKAGTYTLKIIDEKSNYIVRTIEVLPKKLSKVEVQLGSTLLESGGSIGTSAVFLKDMYGNIVSGNPYTLEMEIQGDGFEFFHNNSKTARFTTFNGYKIFRIRSDSDPKQAKISVKVLNDAGYKLVESDTSIMSVEKLQIQFETDPTLQAGGDKQSIAFSVVDTNGERLSNLDTRAYITMNSKYGKITKPYFTIKGGTGMFEIRPGTLAAEQVPIEIQIEGKKQILQQNLSIAPGVPMRVDIKTINTSETETQVQARLQDRYGNTVFTDDDTKLTLEINGKKEEQKAEKGQAIFTIDTKAQAGISHFTVGTSPDISENSFSVKDSETGKSVTISGVGKNAGKIEVLDFIDAESFTNKHYSALYTTLLGANYGDVEQKNYLAGGLIFNKNSKGLAVTSLLESPSAKNNIFSLSANGKLGNLAAASDLSQSIDYTVGFSQNETLEISLYNTALNTDIGTLKPQVHDLELKVCKIIDSCLTTEKPGVLFGVSRNPQYQFYTENSGVLSLREKSGRTYFSVDANGKFTRNSNLSFEVDTQHSGKYMKINVVSGKNIVAFLGLYLQDATVHAIDPETQSVGAKNAFVFEKGSEKYTAKTKGTGKNNNLAVSYNDPFGAKNSINKIVGNNTYAYENFAKKGGLGWKEGNKTLLSFAAGKKVGEATKDFASFALINIGDPVIGIKKQQKQFTDTEITKDFDPSIGRIISRDDDVVDYHVFDYDNDGAEDILLVKSDNYLQLLEKIHGSKQYRDQRNVAHIFDLASPNLLQTGDFSGNGYDDIFFISNDGKPYILSNDAKDFSRVDLAERLETKGRIIQTRSFDMDLDGIDDIVVLDEAGVISIFYGGGSASAPFSGEKVEKTGFGLQLDTKSRDDKGLLYFNGLYQMKQSGKSEKIGEKKQISKAQIEEMIYVQVPYIPISKRKMENVVYGDLATTEETFADIDSLLEMSEANTTRKKIETGYTTTFIKSEYAKHSGIQVEKEFRTEGGKNLKSGDTVDVIITLTNVSAEDKNDFVYMEDVEKYFTFDKKSITVSDSDAKIQDAKNNYDFLVERMNLPAGKRVEIRYTATLKKISFGYMQVGMFDETQEDGDIIFKKSEKNCGQDVNLVKSTGKRKYVNNSETMQCDSSKLPDSLEANAQDADGDGIPDYIENLMQTGSVDERDEFASGVLENLQIDTDGDGIPDEEDDFNTGEDIFESLSDITEQGMEGLEKIEGFINGLSCGFNNGACFATPLNWAPLAPGNDPTFMGYPIGDGLHVAEGIPIFSSMTFAPGWGCNPSVYPPGVFGPGCVVPGAGGALGVTNPANTFRLFVSPTLTGGVGMAACFGGPAIVAGYANPPGLAPLFPGGNCIVIAKPILGCNNDGSGGDPAGQGIPEVTDGFSFINANCDVQLTEQKLKSDAVQEFIESDGESIPGDTIGEVVEDHSVYDGTPLISINGQGQGTELSISIDQDGDVDWSDIDKISKKRIKSFPGFLMNWVTDQIEEVVTKLTDFPDLYIILPDFSGIYDTDLSWQENRKRWRENSGNPDEFELLSTSGIESTGGDTQVEKALGTAGTAINKKVKQVNSGVKEAYEFIASLPLVKIEQEPIYIRVPWVNASDVDRAIESWEASLAAYEQELDDTVNSWENIDENVKIDVEALISSIEENIDIIKEYKDIPQKIQELLNKKQEYLEQILCNIEAISELFGGWISDNGERFKAWVELYILIKAILKSWQLLIDIFVDYEASCKECKNERHDLLNFEFEIISMIVPDIPVIEFPKWPDIILDLHNVRAGVVVKLPEFIIQAEPMVIPDLPTLTLPKSPNVTITLPEIPILPRLEIPELPDLPSLPTVDLPDLPPPPKLPKLFAGFEFIIDILKLVTKAMCILKMSPFHPEWRAGDQIAFLTERNGFLSFDFLNIDIPTFSFPFVDAIKVTTYVNLEYEVDFITELARQIAMPINNFTGDVTNVFDFNIPDVDLSDVVPSDIQVDENGVEISLQETKELAGYLVLKNILSGANYMQGNKGQRVSNTEFKVLVAQALAHPRIAKDPRYDELRTLWERVNDYDFAAENQLIADLKEHNKEKFKTLEDILNTEIIKTKHEQQELQKAFTTGIIPVSQDINSVALYNQKLDPFTQKTFESAGKFFQNNGGVSKEFQTIGEDIIETTKSATREYTHEADSGTVPKRQLLAAQTPPQAISNPSAISSIKNPVFPTTQSASCSAGKNGYARKYEGIYIIQEDGGKKYSYRLFAYTDELSGKEQPTAIDYDNDGDMDLLYFVNNTLYLKENLDTAAQEIYDSSAPYIISASKNPFLTTNFIPAVNNVEEATVSNKMINLSFQGIPGVREYILEYYTKVDALIDDSGLQKHTIYGVAQQKPKVATQGKRNIENPYTIQKTPLSFDSIGRNFRGVTINTKEVQRLSLNGSVAVISNGSSLYTGKQQAQIIYKVPGVEDEQTLQIPKYSQVESEGTMRVIAVNGDVYVSTGKEKEYKDQEILDLKDKPLLAGTTITQLQQGVGGQSSLGIIRSDGTSLATSATHNSGFQVYDLGHEAQNYLFSLPVENDYYYATVTPYQNGIYGTKSKQVLLAPQLKADKNAPELDLDNIRVPIYVPVTVDLGKDIYEEGGVESIKDVYIDFNLEEDSNGDGDPRNDRDSKYVKNIKIINNRKSISFSGEFTKKMKRKIAVVVIDQNDNIGYKEISLEVYVPTPKIRGFDGTTIQGTIGEPVAGEPINIYRYRGGQLTKLQNKDVNSNSPLDRYLAYTKAEGDFLFTPTQVDMGSGLTLSTKVGKLQMSLATIDEVTGKITLQPGVDKNYTIRALVSNDAQNASAYPQLQVIKKDDGEIVFTQTLQISATKIFTQDSEAEGIYVENIDPAYKQFMIPEQVKINPGAFILYTGSPEKAEVVIFPDGRIRLATEYSLVYNTAGEYITLGITYNNKTIASVKYKIKNGDFVMQ